LAVDQLASEWFRRGAALRTAAALVAAVKLLIVWGYCEKSSAPRPSGVGIVGVGKLRRLVSGHGIALEIYVMATRAPTRLSKRTRETKKSIAANTATASVRKPSKPALVQPFYIAVDRQLKSGHETYGAAEKAALAIKKQHPQLHVTVYDTKEHRHTVIEQPKPAGSPTKAVCRHMFNCLRGV
jgi:hypothetical protein